jgi:hypothetical protein
LEDAQDFDPRVLGRKCEVFQERLEIFLERAQFFEKSRVFKSPEVFLKSAGFLRKVVREDFLSSG